MAETRDVRGLSRSAASSRQPVPMPARRWRTRVLLPAVVVLAVLALVAYSTWDAIAPATEVYTGR